MNQRDVKGIFVALFLYLCGAAVVLCADESDNGPGKITVVLSGDGALYQDAVSSLVENLGDTAVVQYSLEQWRQQVVRSQARVYVAIGAAATEALFENNLSAPIMSIMVPSDTFLSLLDRYPDYQTALDQQTLSAIYMDQPPERQLNLIRSLLPAARSVGTLYDKASLKLVDEIASLSGQQGFLFSAREIDEKDNPLQSLKKLYAEVDVYLAVPGQFIFNRSTAKWMLYLSVRSKKPLIGFSREFVSAGALAAVYSTPENISSQAAHCVQQFLQSQKFFCGINYPKNFAVSVNQNIVELMRLEPVSDEQLERELNTLESR